MKYIVFILLIIAFRCLIKTFVDSDFIKKVEETKEQIISLFELDVQAKYQDAVDCLRMITEVKLMINKDLDIEELKNQLYSTAELEQDQMNAELDPKPTQKEENLLTSAMSSKNRISNPKFTMKPRDLVVKLREKFQEDYLNKPINSDYFPSDFYKVSTGGLGINEESNKEETKNAILSKKKMYFDKYLYVLCGDDTHRTIVDKAIHIECEGAIPASFSMLDNYFYAKSDISLIQDSNSLVLRNIRRKNTINPIFNFFMSDMIETVASFWAAKFQIENFKIIEADNIIEIGTLPLFRLMSLVNENKQDEFKITEGQLKTGLKFEDFVKVNNPERDYNFSISRTALDKKVGSKIAELIARLAKVYEIDFKNFFLKTKPNRFGGTENYMEIHEEKEII